MSLSTPPMLDDRGIGRIYDNFRFLPRLIFFSGMCRGCFPTRVRLKKKGVHFPINYVSCNSKYEDLAHVIFEFSFSIEVWRAVDLCDEINKEILETNTAVKAVFLLLQQLNLNHANRMVVILEYLEAQGEARC